MSPLSAARAALRVYAAGAAVILAQLLRRCRGGFLEPGFPRQPDRVAIVTGGTDGIGYSTAKHLARLGMHVIIAGNNDSKAKQVVSKIKEETLNNKVEFLYCDLASMMSIRQFVQKFKMKKIPLHVLINNAGVMMVPQRKTRDGFEEHFGLNYLGHFLLTNLLLDTLRESGSPGHSARVLTVSSATHYVAELNMDDLQSRPNVRLWRAAFCYPWLPDETAAGGRTESLEGFNEGVTAPRASNSQMPFGQRRGTSQKISAQCLLLSPRGVRPEQAGPCPVHVPPPAAAGGRGKPRDRQRGGPWRGQHGPLPACVLGHPPGEEAFQLVAFQDPR
ncbi:dehydrogenase/reductase SDR family member on chromosome X isoform X3 [Trachypithecus francoisi]|uniref:dehydrogenase/reductase SDR family member on chromosome X isoform X3 n=1 Tax=Trachypithecus francoisi TaxID=54180 RepID=UPI00141B789F|nr:dehydrogenase/reductase SDR family member on chromosome X isoform X3 [Trachypithecus francoisi]